MVYGIRNDADFFLSILPHSPAFGDETKKSHRRSGGFSFELRQVFPPRRSDH